LHKVVRARPLRQLENGIKKLISKHRFRSEQCFGTLQRLFGLYRAQYFGVAKIHAQMVMAALSQTLLKAAHKITFNRETPAIAERKPKTQIRTLKSQQTEKHLCLNRETQKRPYADVFGCVFCIAACRT